MQRRTAGLGLLSRNGLKYLLMGAIFLHPLAANAGETKGELSDFWKYTIAISALVFFLGIALFIQIRSEREK